MKQPKHRTTLYLVRHGETEPNRLGIVQGRGVDAPLNEAGRQQAAHLADFLAEIPIHAAYTSTLRRAGETAEILLTRRREPLALQRWAGLDEMNWGIHEGQPYRPPVSDDIARIKQAWLNGRYDVGPERGESVLEVMNRSTAAIQRIVEENPDRSVLVVSHGRMMRILIAALLIDYGLQRMEELTLDNTGVNILNWEEGQFHAESLNSIKHLNGSTSPLAR